MGQTSTSALGRRPNAPTCPRGRRDPQSAAISMAGLVRTGGAGTKLETGSRRQHVGPPRSSPRGPVNAPWAIAGPEPAHRRRPGGTVLGRTPARRRPDGAADPARRSRRRRFDDGASVTRPVRGGVGGRADAHHRPGMWLTPQLATMLVSARDKARRHRRRRAAGSLGQARSTIDQHSRALCLFVRPCSSTSVRPLGQSPPDKIIFPRLRLPGLCRETSFDRRRLRLFNLDPVLTVTPLWARPALGSLGPASSSPLVYRP